MEEKNLVEAEFCRYLFQNFVFQFIKDEVWIYDRRYRVQWKMQFSYDPSCPFTIIKVEEK